jgi:hypothetical protein
MPAQDRIRIELTSEQSKLIKETSGHEISALEFEVKELEQRIAPFCASGTHIPEV